nr:S8 family serine peptidase [Actinacidiphila oryziradicis]
MLATGIAAALTAGSTAPAGAVPGHITGAATAAGTTAGTTLTGQGKTWITLITGDQVAVDAKGKPVGLRHAKGREHIPIQVERLAGHTYLIPQDAAQLIRKGQVDRRLFDITTLSRAEYRKAQRNGLGFIVTYKGASPAAKAELHAADGTVVTHTFKHLGGEAVTTKKQDAADVWAALTNQPSGSPFATAESGLKTVWLDAVQKAALDKSVPQIGAPTAWAAGYDGKGVKIAVLDTGVDKTHPDLATQVVDEKNFSTAATVVDHFGHGTHVASIAAGTGAKSGGKYKGVAPGAQIISGKVLDDDGYGDDAGIIAGLEWAAASGAKVANLSLGGTDTPGVDPIEAAVNTLSASTGTLFVIAAGNSGPEAGSVGSPGSADAALTVGAVDKSNVLADFSSRGPRVGDGAIKPDLTAPGVDITAAAAPGSVIDTDPSVPHPAPGYLTISGTSMATPHVSGAAAILAEEHPDWTGQQIKEALVGSAKGFAYNAFQQGSGRVDLTTAIKQTVVADQVSLSFGTAQWPHNDDPKIDKKVTYRNLGTTDVTLDLSLAATDPKGNAAPTGFFTLDQTQVTVPAGGTAEATVTADSTLGGSVDGSYSAYVTATATDGSQAVRTAAAVNREVESYDITVKHIGRDGQPTKVYDTELYGLTGSAAGLYFSPYDASGTATIRVPKGRYVLASNVYVGDGQTWQGADWIAQPRLDATKNTTVTVDARTAKPVDLTVPDKSATSQFASIDFSVITGHSGVGVGWWLDSYQNFRTAHLGPATAAGELTETVQSTWSHGSGTEYDLAYGFKSTKLLTGYTKHTQAKELSKVNVKEGAPAKNKLGYLFATPDTGSGGSSSIAFQRTLPYTGKVYLGGSGTKWSFDFEQAAADTFDFEADYSTSSATYVAGRTYDRVFNVGVFGPKLSKPFGLFRNGNQIYGYLPLLADGQNRTGASAYTAAKTSLYRNGKLVGSNTDPVTGEPFTVPSGNASYKLSTWITRSSKLSAVSTRVTAAWTFSSKKGTAQLPASVVRFTPALSTSSTAKAKAKLSVPVSVQGSAAGKNLKSLRVYVSFDGGKKWTKLTVKKGKVTVTNPKAGKGVSFKALVTDKKGNTLSQVIYNAYLTK